MTKPKSKTPANKAPAKVSKIAPTPINGLPAPLVDAIADHYFPPESDPSVDLDACRHRPSDGTECTAGRQPFEFAAEALYRIAVHQHRMAEAEGAAVVGRDMMWGKHADILSWPCPYLVEAAWALRDATNRARIRGMMAELREYERELAETYRELGRMSSRTQFKTTLARVVALASLLDGEVVDDIMEQLERGFHMARKAGVSVFEVVLNLKSTILAQADDEGLALAMESKCRAGVKLETAPASAKGKAQVGEDGQVLPEVDRFRKTPLGRELTRAEELERVEQRQREAA